jgi:subtilisin family serine protease
LPRAGERDLAFGTCAAFGRGRRDDAADFPEPPVLEFSLSLPFPRELAHAESQALLDSPDPLFDAFAKEPPHRPRAERGGRKVPQVRHQQGPARFVPLFAIGLACWNCGREVPPRTVADSILVQLRDAAALPDWAHEDESGPLVIPLVQVGDSLDEAAPLLRLPVPAGVDPHALVAELSRDPAVDFAEEISLHEPLSRTPDDPRWKDQWGLAKINAPAAWDASTGSRAVTVAVIDDGVALAHPDLAANAWTNPDEVAANGLDDDGDGIVDDVHGASFLNGVASGDPAPDAALRDPWHGTRAAGIIGAVGANRAGICGVNWRASLMSVRALGAAGGRSDDLVEAVDYASSHGARVINASWGALAGKSQALERAIVRAGKRGAIFVAAAGNEGAATPGFPASVGADNLISVGALDVNGLLAPFSNRGALVAAPGVAILTTSGTETYERADGTSVAAPFVSGLAALLFAAHPERSAAQVRDAILRSAIAMPGVVFGHIDAGRAMAGLEQGGASPSGLFVSRPAVDLSLPEGSAPSAQVISIRSASGAARPVTATSNATWASLLHRDFTTPARATIRIDPSGLAAGDHRASIAFTSSSGEGVSLQITLHLGAQPEWTSAGNGCAISVDGTLHINRGALCTLIAPGYELAANAPQIAWTLPGEHAARPHGARLSAIFPKRGAFAIGAGEGSDSRSIFVLVE